MRVAALALASLLALPQAAGAAVKADYVMFVGGAEIGTIALSADVAETRYQLETIVETQNVAGATDDATTTLFAAGARQAEVLTPQIFTSDYVNKAGQSTQLQITFNEDGPASVLALPPPPKKPAPLADFHKKGALDPVSAIFAMTLAGGSNPCSTPVPAFDGWRRFDIKLTYKGESKIDAGEGFVGQAHKCEGRLEPVAGYSPEAMRSLRDEPQSVEIWMAPFEFADFLVPVRIIAPTPFGGAVIRATSIREE